MEIRAMSTFPSLESIGQDVRYAFRSLVRSPGFTSVALLSLAIGIGGNTAVFSLVDSVRTQALPYREPERLVTLWGHVQRERLERRGNSYPDFLDWQARATSYEGLAAVEDGFITLDAGGESERLRRQGVSASFFPLLGVNAALGRTFSAEEDSVAGRRAVAVLSDGLWRRRFGADPQILGRRVLLDAQPFEVVGVLPPGFKSIAEADLWTPFITLRSPGGLSNRGSRGFPAVGRLKPGVSLAQAQADPDMYFPFLDRNQQLSLAVRTNVAPETLTAAVRAAIRELNSSIPVYNVATMAELVGRQTARSRFTMWLMGVFAALALLLSVVGIYGVMSYLVSERRREIGIRLALGAQAAEILRLIVGHGARLIAAGIVIGAVVSIALQRLIGGLLFGVGPTDMSAGLAVALLAAVALVACYVPAWRATRVDPLSALRHE
jgi:hypothetical protein